VGDNGDGVGALGGHVQEPDETTDGLLADVVDAVAKVRTVLGVGLLESLYQEALRRELVKRGHVVRTNIRVHVDYDGEPLDGYYTVDLLVDGMVVEAKACERLHPTAFAQTLTYLRATNTRIGLLVNFHAVPLRTGIHRMIRRQG